MCFMFKCVLFSIAMARYEIADMEKIPTNLHNFEEVVADFTAELKMVKKNEKFPALK